MALSAGPLVATALPPPPPPLPPPLLERLAAVLVPSLIEMVLRAGVLDLAGNGSGILGGGSPSNCFSAFSMSSDADRLLRAPFFCCCCSCACC